MIDYNQIKEILRAGIWNDLRTFFVDLENGDPRPDEQENITEFISHKFTSPLISSNDIEDTDNETMTLSSIVTMTVSFTCYADSKTNALNLAYKLRNWFNFKGYDYLKENNIVVASIEAMTDRTSFLETGYDHRAGFDVILRTSDVLKRDIEIVETVELNNTEIGE